MHQSANSIEIMGVCLSDFYFYFYFAHLSWCMFGILQLIKFVTFCDCRGLLSFSEEYYKKFY